MKKNIIALVAIFVSANVFAAEWKIGNETYPNKAAATKAAREMALAQAEKLFANPQDGLLALEKGKSRYIAVYPEHHDADKFRCTKRNGEELKFEGKNICILTIKQYANKVVFPTINLEKQAKDEGGFRLASGK